MREPAPLSTAIIATLFAALLTVSCSTGEGGPPGNSPAQATINTAPPLAESQAAPVVPTPVFPPYPAGVTAIDVTRQPSVLASLNRYRAGHSFSAHLPATPGQEKALSLKIAALLHTPDGKTVRHLAVLAGRQGRVLITYIEPLPSLDTQILWRDGRTWRRGWNQTDAVEIPLAAMNREFLAQFAPMLFIDLAKDWHITSAAQDSPASQRAVLVNAVPANAAHPLAAAQFRFDPGSALPVNAWYKQRSTGAEWRLEFNHDAQGNLAGFEAVTPGQAVLASVVAATEISLSSIPDWAPEPVGKTAVK